MENEEIWKDISGFEGCYQVSNFGNVKSLDRIAGNNHKYKGKAIKLRPNWKGYLMASLSKGSEKKMIPVHRLVAQAFIPNPNDLPHVNHKDENKENNSIENLEWCDAKYNNNYGLRNKKVAKKLGKPVIATRLEDGKREWYRSFSEMARALGITESTIWHAVHNKRIVCGRTVKLLENERMSLSEVIENLKDLSDLKIESVDCKSVIEEAIKILKEVDDGIQNS